MNILLLGASGKTGTKLLNQALEAGHHVTAVVRTPSKLAIRNSALNIVIGDATDVNILTEAMQSSDVLLSTLGSMKNATLMTESSRAIVKAAQKSSLRRVVMMSSFAVNRDQLSGSAKIMTGMVMKKAIADKSTGEAVLRSSGLDWTIVYAVALNNDSNMNGVKVIPATEKVGLGKKISRAAVAAWMLKEAEADNYVTQNVTISQ